MTTTFLFPSFNKSEKDKVNNIIDVPSEHVLVKSAAGDVVPAIASEGFPANRDGTYVFVTFLQSKDPEEIVNAQYITIGFTSTKTVDSRSALSYPSNGGMNGVCGHAFEGKLLGGNGESSKRWIKEYLPPELIRPAKEIISILTISDNGKKRNVQFIFDANEGPVHELATTDFENKIGGNEIFPVVTLRYKDDQLECIPFNQVKSRSPKIDELMKEFNRNKNILSSSPSTSTSENDAVISQLRDQVARSQDVVIRENEKQMKNMREMYEKQLEQLHQQLRTKDQQLEVKDKQLDVKDQKLDLSHSQLELERAEHQKTRNLLHQIKMELKDMEIFYLTREKESGQRRQRDEETDQFKVKQEPGI